MLNEIELTILALVAEGPRHRAEVEQMIDERGMREWLMVGSSSARYILDKLVQQALLSGHDDAAGQPSYAITEAGRGVLQTAVANLLAQPRQLGTGIELALANLKVLKPLQVYQAMQQRQVTLRQQLQTSEQLWNGHREDTYRDELGALYAHGIALLRAELDWLGQFLRDWRQRYPSVDPDNDTNVTKIHRKTGSLNPAKQVQRMQRPPRAE